MARESVTVPSLRPRRMSLAVTISVRARAAPPRPVAAAWHSGSRLRPPGHRDWHRDLVSRSR
jgi:hypothetical protein